MAISRVEGPMLLTNLDRQGIDLQFSTSSNPLVYLDFTNFVLNVNQLPSGQQKISVNGNLSAGNVILDNGGIVTTRLLNQPLYLQANGIANVYVTNANVISGRVDGTVIGGLDPRPATFTYLQSNAMATLNTANVSNLKANRVVFTKGDNSQLVDDNGLQYFTGNGTLVVNALTTIQQQLFNTLSASNIILRTANVGQVSYFAANGYTLTSNALTFSGYTGTALANLLTSGNLSLTSTTPDQLLFVDPTDNNKVKGTPYLTFDGQNMRANGTVRVGQLLMFNQTISTAAGTNYDLILAPDGSGVVSVTNSYITNLLDPQNPQDAATKKYVDSVINVSQQTSKRIYQGIAPGSYVDVSDNDIGVANVTVVIQGTEYARFQNGYANLFSITTDPTNRIGTKSGPLILEPGFNDRVEFLNTSAITLPSGNVAQRWSPYNTGDFRYNTELGTVEWFDGTNWDNPANSVIYSRTINPDGVSSSYYLDQTATTESVLVNFNGVIQTPGDTYSIAGNVISFTTVPLTTDRIEMRFFTGTVSHATNPIVVDKLWVTADTVTVSNVAVQYTGSGYRVGDVLTMLGGINLGYPAQFTVASVVTANGNSISHLTLSNIGTYQGTNLPANPVFVSGGYGSGAQVNVLYNKTSAFATVDTWSTATGTGYRAAKYTYSAKSIAANLFETGDIHVTHNGITAYYNVTPFVGNVGSSFLTWSFTISGQSIMTVAVKGNTAAYDTQVKFHATYFTDA